jgi:hypothetical protein
VSPSDGYAFGSAVKKKIEAFEAACVVRFGDDAPAVACVGSDGDVTFFTYDDPVLSETTYVRLSDAVVGSRSRLITTPSAFLEDSVVIQHEHLPGGSVRIPAIPRAGEATEGRVQAVIDAILNLR